MRRAACVLLVLLAAGAAHAHTRSMSWSSWELDGRAARVRFRIPQLELTRLPWGIVAAPRFSPELGRYLTESLRLEAGGKPCPVVDGPRAQVRVAGPTSGLTPFLVSRASTSSTVPSHSRQKSAPPTLGWRAPW